MGWEIGGDIWTSHAHVQTWVVGVCRKPCLVLKAHPFYGPMWMHADHGGQAVIERTC